MMTTLEGYPMLWQRNDSAFKEKYEGILKDIALGVDNSTTESFTKYENVGLKPEEIVLIRLAMEKADKKYGNGNGYIDKKEKEKGLDMVGLMKLTQKEKEAVMGMKFDFKS